MSDSIFKQDPTLLSIFSEGFLYAFLFIVLIENGAQKWFAVFLQQQGIYEKLKGKEGFMSSNVASDVVIMLGFGLQHVIAGSLLVFGALTGNLAMIRSGILCEWGWETKDYFNVVTRTGPYRNGKVSDSFLASMKYHHLPGMVVAPPVLLYGVHQSHHVQIIGAIMILGGGMGVLANVVRMIFRFGYEANSPILYTVGALEAYIFFGFARFVVFPIEVCNLVRDLLQANHHVIAAMVLAGFLFMLPFNVKVLQLKISKLKESKDAPAEAKAETPKLLKHHSSSFHPVIGNLDD